MARKKGQTASDSAKPRQTIEELSDDQRYSLTEQHKKKYLTLHAAKVAADTALKNFGKIIKADLGSGGLDDIKAIIQASTPEGEAKIRAEIERQARVLRWLGVPIGTQDDLFPENDRTPIADRAFAEGKRQGLAGESNNNQHHVTTEAHRQHNAGYAEGQTTLASGFKKLDDTPKGSVPRDEWQKRTREQNEEVERDIKETSRQMSSRAAVDSLAAH